MQTKEPVMLVVMIEARRLRWFAAGLTMTGEVLPLLSSEIGDLEPYTELGFDEQASFLRHRFCGILQHGCDRLWPRMKKAVQFVFIFDEQLEDPSGQLTQRVAEHFVEWMTNPPVVAFAAHDGFADIKPGQLERLAGDPDPTLQNVLNDSLPALASATAAPELWEVSRKRAS